MGREHDDLLVHIGVRRQSIWAQYLGNIPARSERVKAVLVISCSVTNIIPISYLLIKISFILFHVKFCSITCREKNSHFLPFADQIWTYYYWIFIKECNASQQVLCFLNCMLLLRNLFHYFLQLKCRLEIIMISILYQNGMGLLRNFLCHVLLY